MSRARAQRRVVDGGEQRAVALERVRVAVVVGTSVGPEERTGEGLLRAAREHRRAARGARLRRELQLAGRVRGRGEQYARQGVGGVRLLLQLQLCVGARGAQERRVDARELQLRRDVRVAVVLQRRGARRARARKRVVLRHDARSTSASAVGGRRALTRGGARGARERAIGADDAGAARGPRRAVHVAAGNAVLEQLAFARELAEAALLHEPVVQAVDLAGPRAPRRVCTLQFRIHMHIQIANSKQLTIVLHSPNNGLLL